MPSPVRKSPESRRPIRRGVSTHRLTLRDRLSRLTLREAAKLLGAGGEAQILRAANLWEIDMDDDCHVGDDLFRVRLPERDARGRPVVVSLTLRADARQRLLLNCTACPDACLHKAAALSLILEAKTPLGLAQAPPQPEEGRTPDEAALVAQAIDERTERARTEKMKVVAQNPRRPWSDYLVTNRVSGKTYRVALRGLQPGDSYCSCPDFRTNTLGTCKHILKVLGRVRRTFTPATLRRPWKPDRLSLHLRYGEEIELRLTVPDALSAKVAAEIAPLRDRAIDDMAELMSRLKRLDDLGSAVHLYPDAEEWIEQRLFERRIHRLVTAIRRDPAAHPLRDRLLKVPLLPYQLDGIAFVAGAGRAILADEMGLGKTIQGVGVAELLAREAGIGKVLVVCPASLKSQWRAEIHKFCNRSVQLVGGAQAQRAATYRNDCFFTICNYEQVVRDISSVEQVPWDLVILDEGQRIKNWETKTARVIKTLRSRFALLLSGTPLENRLDDLYSVVQFVDDRRLGPGFRFFHRHKLLDDDGKLVGYHRLDELRQALTPVLLRRTRDSVRLELPERTTEIVRIAPTDEQLTMHAGFMQTVCQISCKPYLTEMDLLRLQKALLMARMTADSTVLVDKQAPGYSSKLECLDELLGRLCSEEGRKIVVFSEWTTMLNQIEKILKRRGLAWARLDGQVPQKVRAMLVNRFQEDPACQLFLTTNAGSTGLNLQAANTVVNVDLPWNPAVLEQRIARAHRMGQNRAVQVYVLVTEGTIEEGLLTTIALKKELALAALDGESDVTKIDLVSGREELRRKLELLLGAIPAAPEDQSTRRHAAQQIEAVSAVAVDEAVQPAGGQPAEPSAACAPPANSLGALTPQGDSQGASEGMSAPTNRLGGLGGSPGTSGVSGAAGGMAGEHRARVAAAGGELLGAAFRFLGELVSQQTTAAPPDALVGALRDGLGQCVEAGDDGRSVLRISLPDASTLDGLAQTLARLMVPAAAAEQVSDHQPRRERRISSPARP